MPKVCRATRLTWAIALLFAVIWSGVGLLLRPMALNTDFACMYMGARIVQQGHLGQLYDLDVQAEQWRNLGSPNAIVPYLRPPFYAVPHSLLSWFSLTTAYTVACAASALLALGVWKWAAWRYGEAGLVLAALFLPLPMGIGSGQDNAVLLAIVVAAVELLRRGRPGASGALMALGLFKFHLLLLVLPVMLLRKQRRWCAAFAATGGLLAVLSLALVGVQGVRDYAALLSRKDIAAITPSPELMPNVRGLLLSLGLGEGGAWTLAPLAALVIWAVWKAPVWATLLAALAGMMLAVPHVFGYDATMLLPLLLAGHVEGRTRLARTLCVWLCTPLPYMANLAGAPWSAVLPASLLLLLLALGWEREEVAEDTAGDLDIHAPQAA